MAGLTQYKQQFDNAYEEIFQKVLIGKAIANLRFEPVLEFGESVKRVAYDISGVRVRSTVRGNASTIDQLSDTFELLTVNLEKETAFYISDGEVTQAGPLNPGEEIGAKVAHKVAQNLDSYILAEIKNAYQTFDNGDLTTLASDNTPITLTTTTVPQMASRMPAKLRKAHQVLTDLIFVLDSYALADVTQYLMGKNIDLAGAVFKNGYAGDISTAQLFVSENLPGESLLTFSNQPANNDTITINGVVFTFKSSSLGTDPGNVLIGANLAATLTNLAEGINDPGTTTSTFVALTPANQIVLTDDLKLSATATATTVKLSAIGSGRMTVAENSSNATVTYNLIHCYFGKKGAIDVVVQDLKEVDMRPCADRRGTNVFSSYLAGVKTFADGAKKFLDVKIAC